MLNYCNRWTKVMVKRNLNNLHLSSIDTMRVSEGFIVLWTIACCFKIMTIG